MNRMMMPTMPVVSIEPIGHVLLDSADQGTRMTTQCKTLQMSQSDVLNYRNDLLAGSELVNMTVNGWTCIEPCLTPADEGNVANALVAGAQPLLEGLNHVRFFMTPGAVGSFNVGLTNEAKYGSSWGMNGIMITGNGNLSGQGLYKANWTAPLQAGQLIDLFMEVQGFSLQVWLAVDGVPRGLAYWLDFSANPSLIQTLRPAVQFADGAHGAMFFVVTHNPVEPSPEGRWRGPMTNHSTENPFMM